MKEKREFPRDAGSTSAYIQAYYRTNNLGTVPFTTNQEKSECHLKPQSTKTPKRSKR